MIALAIAVVALWGLAAFLWLADGSSTRMTINTVLAEGEEQQVREEHRAA